LFCDHSSKDILNLLLEELERAGGQLRLKTSVTAIKDVEDGSYKIETEEQTLQTTSLVVATGGLSIPTMGASDFGYQLARQYGHTVLETRASLVPFTWNNRDKDAWSPLSGVSLPVTVTAAQGQSFSLDALITHRGLSGPAMLQISNYWEPGENLEIDWLPGQDSSEQLKADRHDHGKKALKNWLTQWMPARLAEHFCDLLALNKSLAELTKADVERIDQTLHRWEFAPGGTEGYRTAEVTKGGVDTQQISSKTMESQLRPGLFFIGEVLDVTGWLGGYNFQWAWSSGWAAAQHV
jgi:predicted Rossmann fold flavoprotein